MFEIKKVMEKDEEGIDRQIFPETVPEAIIGLEQIIKDGTPVLSVNGQTGAVLITKEMFGLENALTELPYASEETDGILSAALFRKLFTGETNGEVSGTYLLPVASAERLGGIKIGGLLEITEEGVLSATQQTEENFTEELKTKLDGLKVLKAGANISIGEDGTISSTGGSSTSGVNQTYVDQKSQEVLQAAKSYTDEKLPNITLEKVGTVE